MGFPCGSAGKESACSVGDLGSIPGLGRSPGEGKGYPLQYSGLENSMDYSPWGRKELDTTEQISLLLSYILWPIGMSFCKTVNNMLKLSSEITSFVAILSSFGWGRLTSEHG